MDEIKAVILTLIAAYFVVGCGAKIGGVVIGTTGFLEVAQGVGAPMSLHTPSEKQELSNFIEENVKWVK